MKNNNNIKTGDKLLVTTRDYFIAPDGNQYRAVFGTYNGIIPSKDPDQSTIQIGSMFFSEGFSLSIIKCDHFNNSDTDSGKRSKILDADKCAKEW